MRDAAPKVYYILIVPNNSHDGEMLRNNLGFRYANDLEMRNCVGLKQSTNLAKSINVSIIRFANVNIPLHATLVSKTISKEPQVPTEIDLKCVSSVIISGEIISFDNGKTKSCYRDDRKQKTHFSAVAI